MYFKSRKISLLILGATSIVCSRAMFFFFDDPEGPNLLIVMVGAGAIHFLSLALYLRNTFASVTGLKRLLLAIITQVVIATIFYFLMNWI